MDRKKNTTSPYPAEFRARAVQRVLGPHYATILRRANATPIDMARTVPRFGTPP